MLHMYWSICYICTEVYARYLLMYMLDMYWSICYICTEVHTIYLLKHMLYIYWSICCIWTEVQCTHVGWDYYWVANGHVALKGEGCYGHDWHVGRGFRRQQPEPTESVPKDKRVRRPSWVGLLRQAQDKQEKVRHGQVKQVTIGDRTHVPERKWETVNRETTDLQRKFSFKKILNRNSPSTALMSIVSISWYSV